MKDTVIAGARRSLLTVALLAMAASHFASCGSGGGNTSTGSGGSPHGSGGRSGPGGGLGSGGVSGSGGQGGVAGQPGSGGKGGSAGQAGAGGQAGQAGSGGTAGTYVVAMVQSTKVNASEITQSDIASMVTGAVSQAGGLDFIHDGMTVVLKPNIVTPYSDFGTTPLPVQVNGIATDWRVVKAVADLVRAKNPTGKILVMEGSVVPSSTAFSLMGYNAANFGSSVDELLGFEGTGCRDRTSEIVEKTAVGGRVVYLNKRYANADVVISIPTMKTHMGAGITGAVKNLGVGATPAGRYSATTVAANDCTRGQTAEYIDHSSPESLGRFIHDYYSVRPADFVVMDALQGLQNGPASQWSGTTYAADKMNMRLILAGKNAVAVDTIEALVMKCDPKKVPHLTELEAHGFGTTDISKITVVGKQVSEVAKPFAVKNQTAICPGT